MPNPRIAVLLVLEDDETVEAGHGIIERLQREGRVECGEVEKFDADKGTVVIYQP